MENRETPEETKQLKTLNRWLGIAAAFIVMWTIGTVVYINRNTTADPSIEDVSSTNSYSNQFPLSPVLKSSFTKTNRLPYFIQKDTYARMDLVIINYFFVEGRIISNYKDTYVVMYRDYNGVLQEVTLPKEMLLSPTSYSGASPQIR